MRYWVLFLCCFMWFGAARGQTCYNIFNPDKPKIQLFLKSSQLHRLLNKKKLSVYDEAWLHTIHKISQFEPQLESNFSVETQKLNLEGSALFVGNTLHLKISFLSTVLTNRLKNISYVKTMKKHNPNITTHRVLALNEVNTNLKAPLREVLGFIRSLTEHIKSEHPHIEKIELTADGIHNERLYNKLKALHFKTDVPYLKRLLQSYYIIGNMALYSYLVTGVPNLEWYGAAFVSISNAALFWVPFRARFKKFRHEGASLKLTIPLVESDNSRP